VIGQGLPEVIDFGCLAGRANVIEDFPHDAMALLVFDEALDGSAPGKGVLRGDVQRCVPEWHLDQICHSVKGAVCCFTLTLVFHCA
jgi:hypothetical protein